MRTDICYDYILFDADGTLFDYERAETYALEKTFQDFKIAFLPGYLDKYKTINSGYWKAFEKGEVELKKLRIDRFKVLLDALGIEAEAEPFSRGYINNLSLGIFLMPGALELLKNLHDKIDLGIITNGISEVQRRRFSLSKVESYFKGIIISEEIGFSKPSREYFEYTCRTLGIEEPSRVLVVGDSLSSDILGGNNYGMATCWLNPKKLTPGEIKPHFTIAALEELHTVLTQSNPKLGIN